MKYFVIGFNKTATITIHNLFLLNGIKSQHDNDWNLDKYDAFSDNRDLSVYRELTIKYPDAIFILNIRNIKEWILSRVNHGIIYKRICGTDISREWEWKWAYPMSESKILDKIEIRNTHIQSVLNHFKSRNMMKQLVVLDVNQNDWIKFFCSQLNLNKQVDIHYHSTKHIFNILEKKDGCEEELKAAKDRVDALFLKIKDDPKYKCIIYDTTELDNLICQFKNNIVKTKT
jgi:hypothetical protein